jgi:pyruvate kinase
VKDGQEACRRYAGAVQRKTKIIATLGPAVDTQEAVTDLIVAGMNVARLNFSHGTYDSHRRFYQWVRSASQELGAPVAILQDIQGPRIRVGTFPGGSALVETGSEVMLVRGEGEGDATHLFIENLDSSALSPGDPIRISDGLIHLETIDTDGELVRARTVEGGVVHDHKGVAFPGVRIDIPIVTAKDQRDFEFGAELGIDMVAASFVGDADDVRTVRRYLAPGIPIIAKIESVYGYANLEDILTEAYGAMVARGDLGVELSFEAVPRAQKEILAATNAAARLSITATEMLESMTSSPRPTRAEVTDVSSAVLDGADALMLSAETAIGRYPTRVVTAMARICVEAETSPDYRRGPEIKFLEDSARFASATAQACVDAAANLGLGAIVAFTESGSTARLISKYRPRAAIYAYTPEVSTYRRMALYAGVTPHMFERVSTTDEMIRHAEQHLLAEGHVSVGDGVVMAAGVPPNIRASTNLMTLHTVGSSISGGTAVE